MRILRCSSSTSPLVEGKSFFFLFFFFSFLCFLVHHRWAHLPQNYSRESGAIPEPHHRGNKREEKKLQVTRRVIRREDRPINPWSPAAERTKKEKFQRFTGRLIFDGWCGARAPDFCAGSPVKYSMALLVQRGMIKRWNVEILPEIWKVYGSVGVQKVCDRSQVICMLLSQPTWVELLKRNKGFKNVTMGGRSKELIFTSTDQASTSLPNCRHKISADSLINMPWQWQVPASPIIWQFPERQYLFQLKNLLLGRIKSTQLAWCCQIHSARIQWHLFEYSE